jgi:hypothetical protein
MPFFDDVEPPPEPEAHVEYRSPPWAEVPATVVPVTVALDLMLARTPAWAAWVGGASVTPEGIAFTLTVLGRVKTVDVHAMHPRMDGAAAPRFGVGFADGRKAVAGHRRFGHRLPTGDEEREIVLSPRDGSGGSGRWTQTYWLWPLPPPGPLTFALELAGRGDRGDDRGGRRRADPQGGRPSHPAVARRTTAAARGRQRLVALHLRSDLQLRAVAAARKAGGNVALRTLVEVRAVGRCVGGPGAEGARDRGDDAVGHGILRGRWGRGHRDTLVTLLRVA